MPAHIDLHEHENWLLEKMAAEAMLNKNRMMVFKNKGKDQEVSESLLLSHGEVIEFLARWKLY